MAFTVQGTAATGSAVALSPLRMPGCVWFDDVADLSTVVTAGRITQLRNLASIGPSFYTPDPAGVGPLAVARGIGSMLDMAWDGATTVLRGDTVLLASSAFTLGALFKDEVASGVVFGGGDYNGVTYSLEIVNGGALRCLAGIPGSGGAEAVTSAKFIDGRTHVVQATWNAGDGTGAIVLQVDGEIAPLAVDTPSVAPMVSAGDSNAIGATCHPGFAPASFFQGLSPVHWMLDRKMTDSELAQAFAWARIRAGAIQ